MQINVGQNILKCAVNADQPLLARKLDTANNVAGIDGNHHPAQPVGKGHRPGPLGDFPLLNVEFGIRKIFDIAEMVKMRMSNEHRVNLGRGQANTGQHIRGGTPVLHAKLVAQMLAIIFIIIADIHHRNMAVAFYNGITIGKFYVALIVRPI